MPGIVCSAPSAVEAMVPRTHAPCRREWTGESALTEPLTLVRSNTKKSRAVSDSQSRATATIVSVDC